MELATPRSQIRPSPIDGVASREVIIGVALLSEDGRLWSLPAPAQHGYLFALAIFQNVDPQPCREGFTTASGRFVDREEGLAIARAGRVLQNRNPDARDRLYSEDVW